jgi:hypothetical protein
MHCTSGSNTKLRGDRRIFALTQRADFNPKSGLPIGQLSAKGGKFEIGYAIRVAASNSELRGFKSTPHRAKMVVVEASI